MKIKKTLPIFWLCALAACTVAPTPTVALPTTAAPSPTLTSEPRGIAIHDIQGAGHLSSFDTKEVANVRGLVTALRSDGFYMQDPQPDNEVATSEGILVFSGTLPKVKLGDLVQVSGVVKEFYAREVGLGDLSITEITKPQIEIVSSGNKLPDPVVIGKGGRVPPNKIIKTEAGDADKTKFAPQTDGLDFYETLEGMLVQLNNAVAVGPTNNFRETPLVGDRGELATKLSARGALVISAEDYNPERLHLDDVILPVPTLNVGDRFTQPVVGIMDYSFGNFKLYLTQRATVESGGLKPTVVAKQKANQISVATFNVENFSPASDRTKIANLAKVIVENLQAPDIIATEEFQDNNGEVNDKVTDAAESAKVLIEAIKAAGGPTYQYRDIAPADDNDGGAPGGNIRVGFLFRVDRGVQFIDRAGGGALSAVEAKLGAQGVELSFSPGRVNPLDRAYNNSRKPLAAEFLYNGHKLIVIVNHFNSKGGDSALMGRRQPPQLASEAQRLLQATALGDFVKTLLTLDPPANVIVLGDLNDFYFSKTLAKLKEAGLNNLMDLLPENERYDYIYEGNGQTLDHILVSNNLLKAASPEFEVVHVNSEYAVRSSDHDPLIARFTFSSK